MATDPIVIENNVVTVLEVAGDVVILESVQTEAIEIAELLGFTTNGDKTYEHTQAVAASVWTVNHGLGKIPSIVVIDSANTVVVGDVEHVSTSQAILTFSAPFAGRAYCN